MKALFLTHAEIETTVFLMLIKSPKIFSTMCNFLTWITCFSSHEFSQVRFCVMTNCASMFLDEPFCTFQQTLILRSRKLYLWFTLKSVSFQESKYMINPSLMFFVMAFKTQSRYHIFGTMFLYVYFLL